MPSRKLDWSLVFAKSSITDSFSSISSFSKNSNFSAKIFHLSVGNLIILRCDIRLEFRRWRFRNLFVSFANNLINLEFPKVILRICWNSRFCEKWSSGRFKISYGKSSNSTFDVDGLVRSITFPSMAYKASKRASLTIFDFFVGCNKFRNRGLSNFTFTFDIMLGHLQRLLCTFLYLYGLSLFVSFTQLHFTHFILIGYKTPSPV